MKLVVAFSMLAALAPTPASEPMKVMGAIGCLVAEDGEWYLTDATEPVLGTEIDGDLDPAASGALRFHLIGTLDEFEAPKHEGHKVRVKGLVIDGEPEPNLNVTSVKHVAPSCP